MRRWFHPHLSGHDAERLLLENGFDGAYLVRPSQTQPGDYALTVRRGGAVTHIKIQFTGDCYDLFGGDKFANLSELVSHYTSEEGCGQLREKDGNVIELRHAYLCEDPTTERWFHGFLSGSDSEAALRDRGQDGSFLVRASQSKPGCFVLSVRTGGRISHIMIRDNGGKFDLGGGTKFKDLVSLIEHYKVNPLIEASGSVVCLRQPFNATRMNISSISGRFDELSKEASAQDGKAGFSEEFEQLQQMESKHLKLPRIEGSKPENKSKNRYKNILPYDYTRVKLVDVGPEPGADYINANYIDGDNGFKRKYIASQGCLPTTTGSFWQMIWENNVYLVAMITKTQEMGKHKCTPYWPPRDGDTEVFGKFSLRLITTASHDGYQVRRLEVTKLETGEMREVTQYHYTNWPDHGVPDDREVLELILKMRRDLKQLRRFHPDMGPFLVHCSAGIGRTGTVIVIDKILDRIDREGTEIDVDIQQTIQDLRAQRSGMIQTAAQYRFVYKAIKDHFANLEAIAKGEPPSIDANLYLTK
eukprot:m.5714 g.5714  ORF g.5714 m.5714 type:complete len:530 (-) comp5081_c0_seq1:154-1743(-)